MTEREAIVIFLREEQAKIRRQMHDEVAKNQGITFKAVQLDGCRSTIDILVTGINRGDHLIGHEVERDACPMCEFQRRIREE